MGKILSQKRFVKGTSPAPSILTQSPGSLQRIKNFLLTQRGALQTSDGSFRIGTVSGTYIEIVCMGVFNNYASGVYPFYPVFSVNPATNRMNLFIGYPGSPPLPLNYSLAAAINYAVPSLSAALLAPGDPDFAAGSSASTDYPIAGGATTATVDPPTASAVNSSIYSGFPSVALVAGDTVVLTVDYNSVHVGLSGTGGFIELAYSINGGGTFVVYHTETGTGGDIPPSTLPFTIPAGLANLTNLQVQAIAHATRLSFAGSSTVTLTLTGITATVTKASTLSPYGGVAAQACLIPEILQFTNTTILILGNGIAPATTDVTLLAAAAATPLTNTFTANYPSWQPSVSWSVGDQIAQIVGGTTYLFTATQGGLSGTVSPTFPATLGTTVIDNQVIWRNDGAVSTSPAPRGAAHGIIYAGSLWLANTSPQTTSDNLDGPTVLKMSDTNNPQSWNPLNVAFIGRDDGTQITGLATFTIAEAGIAPTGSLCVFKEFSTYQVFGVFGSTDFQITVAQTDLGCISARTIQFLPGFGIARFTHLGFAIFDGVRDRLISEEIRPYIFGGIVQEADINPIDFAFAWFGKGTQSTVPPMYYCAMPLRSANGVMTRLFCYDLVMKAWLIIDLPWPISALESVRVGEGKPILLAGRSDNGIVERIQAGDEFWDTGTGSQARVQWSGQFNDLSLEGGSQRAFCRALAIRGQTLDNSLPPLISVNVFIDGQPMTPSPIDYFIEPQPGSNQFQLEVDVMMNCQVVHVTIAGEGRLILDSIDWEMQPKQGRKVIS